MKKLCITALFFAFLAIAIPSTARAASEEGLGGIISFLTFGGIGCSAPPTMNCSSDPESGLFNSIACKTMQTFSEGVTPLYCYIVSNPIYLQAVDAALMLYVIFLGLSYLFGVVPMRTGPAAAKLIKAVIVYSILVNADIYFSVVYTTVMQTPQEIVNILLRSQGSTSQNFFQYVDEGIAKILDSEVTPAVEQASGQTYTKTQLKIFLYGIALWQLGGDLVGGLFFAVVVGWISSYFSIMIRYLLALLSMMFVLMLGPIFLPTLLFDKIRYIGDEWIKLLISFIIQIVVVVTYVIMVQTFYIEFYDMIKDSLDKNPIQQGQTKWVNQYGEDTYREESGYGYTPQTAQAALGDAANKIPQMTFQMIIMLCLVLLSHLFMERVPSLAVLLSGNPRFIRLFSGRNFAQGTVSESPATLAGQNRPDASKQPESSFSKLFEQFSMGR